MTGRGGWAEAGAEGCWSTAGGWEGPEAWERLEGWWTGPWAEGSVAGRGEAAGEPKMWSAASIGHAASCLHGAGVGAGELVRHLCLLRFLLREPAAASAERGRGLAPGNAPWGKARPGAGTPPSPSGRTCCSSGTRPACVQRGHELRPSRQHYLARARQRVAARSSGRSADSACRVAVRLQCAASAPPCACRIAPPLQSRDPFASSTAPRTSHASDGTVLAGGGAPEAGGAAAAGAAFSSWRGSIAAEFAGCTLPLWMVTRVEGAAAVLDGESIRADAEAASREPSFRPGESPPDPAEAQARAPLLLARSAARGQWRLRGALLSSRGCALTERFSNPGVQQDSSNEQQQRCDAEQAHTLQGAGRGRGPADSRG